MGAGPGLARGPAEKCERREHREQHADPCQPAAPRRPTCLSSEHPSSLSVTQPADEPAGWSKKRPVRRLSFSLDGILCPPRSSPHTARRTEGGPISTSRRARYPSWSDSASLPSPVNRIRPYRSGRTRLSSRRRSPSPAVPCRCRCRSFGTRSPDTARRHRRRLISCPVAVRLRCGTFSLEALGIAPQPVGLG